jgi:hypothetical protein
VRSGDDNASPTVTDAIEQDERARQELGIREGVWQSAATGGTRMADFNTRRGSFIAMMNENGYVR